MRTLKLQNLKLALKADSGLALGTIYPLVNERNIIGRSVDVAVPVDDSKVSRNHAAIDLQNGFHYLVDLGSTNGTYLNGRRIDTPAMISLGDEVRIGTAVLKVELLDNAKASAGRPWNEQTRAILMPVPSELPEPENVDAGLLAQSSLVHGLIEKQKSISAKYGHWISVFLCLVIIAAAVVSSFV